MRTNIVLNDDLVKKALQLTPTKSKRELIENALQEYVQNHSKKDLRELRGKIEFADGYDYKALRAGRV